MRAQEVLDALRKHPFEPFRLQLTNGQSYEIHHRDFATVTRSSVFIGLSSGEDEIPDRAIQCDLLHVVSLEPINGARKPT